MVVPLLRYDHYYYHRDNNRANQVVQNNTMSTMALLCYEDIYVLRATSTMPR